MESNSNQSLIRSLTILGSVVILAFVALTIWGPDNDAVQSVVAPIITIVTLLVTGLLTLRVASEAKDGINEVHAIVNSQRTAMEKQIAALRERLDAVHSTLAVERASTGAHAVVNPPAVLGATVEGVPTVEAPILVVAPEKTP